MIDLTALRERVVALDEEFSGGNRGYAYHIIPPLDSSKCVLYMTKFSIYWGVSDEARYVPDFGIIGRYGLQERMKSRGWMDLSGDGNSFS